MKIWCGVLVMLMLVVGCEDVFEYSPNQVFDDDTPVGINRRNLNSIAAQTPDDTTTIAFIGDSQRFYDELNGFVDKVNGMPDVDFVFLAGDISDFGLLEEFEQVEERFSKLNKPYIGVVGNHDVLANGQQTFERMFGPLDFSFVYDSVKFIVHNTNGREYPAGQVPDLDWLEEEFERELDEDEDEDDDDDDDHPAVTHYVTLSHIPPFDGDFDQTLVQPYVSLLRENKTLISLHGHTHQFKYGFPFEDGIPYMTSHSFELRSFVLLKIAGGNVSFSIIEY